MKMIAIIVIFNLVIISCHKEIVYNPPPITKNCSLGSCDTSKLELVWQVPLNYDTSGLTSIPPIWYKGNVIFSRFTFGGGYDTLKAYDGENGKLKWSWADYFNDGGSFVSRKAYLQGDNLFFNTWQDVYAINAQTGNTIIKNQFTDGTGDPDISVYNRDIFHIHTDKNYAHTQTSNLVRLKINQSKWDTIFTQPRDGELNPYVGLPAIWVNPVGDSIALFKIIYVHPLATKQKVDFVAYNMTKKDTLFRYNDIDKYKIGSIAPSLVSGNYAYVAFTNSIICFDLINKQIKWSKDSSGGFSSSYCPFIIVDGKLYVKPVNRSFYQLSPETGTQIWIDNNNGSGNSDFVNNKGILYYTCDGNDQIIAFDTKTNTKIWQEPSPNHYANKLNGNKKYADANIGYGGIAIDTTLGYLYTSDFYFAMCIKLPKQ